MEREPLKVYCRGCHVKLDISDLPPYAYFDCPECGTTIRVPERFGRYLLEKVCGTGRTSKVYRAIDSKLARRVAVKIAEPDSGGKHEFYDSAKLISQINHPSIVPVLDCGSIDGRSYAAMKYMERGDLKQMKKNNALPSFACLGGYFCSIASCLAAAAELSIAHHDVTPANMLVSAENEAMLGDFDQADIREYGETGAPCLEQGDIDYMSPERMREGGEDQRGDVFSLGVSMYEIFSGELPFGSSDSPEELFRRRENMAFSPLIAKAPRIPEYFSALVSSMLSFDGDLRPDYFLITSTLKRLSQERF